eukprot:4026891-Lingulodinium_polyedra.AAC.1
MPATSSCSMPHVSLSVANVACLLASTARTSLDSRTRSSTIERALHRARTHSSTVERVRARCTA